MKKTLISTMVIFTVFLSSCTYQQKIIGAGAGLGALAGQIITTSTHGTLIGAGIGAVIGIMASQDRTDYGWTNCHKVTRRTYRDGVYTGETVEERCDGYISQPYY